MVNVTCCRTVSNNVSLFVVIIICALIMNVMSMFQKEENITTTTAEPLDSDEETDLPDYVVQKALYVDYGRFSTIDFHYHNRQYMGNRSDDMCYDHWTRCLSTLVVPMPVCAYDWSWNTVTKNSYCDVYFDNCLQKTKWRILSYGKCVDAFAEDTRRFLSRLFNITHI